MRARTWLERFVVLFAVVAPIAIRPAAAQSSRPAVPADLFPRPTGPYAIGTLDTVWVDEQREERLTKAADDKRHVPVQVWYPAEATGGSPARYILRPAEFEPASPFGPALHVTTHAVVGAPVAKAGGKFPVLLYNHGGGWSRFTATFQVEQLVSLGYVVVGVDHLGFNQSKSLANGYAFKGDTLGFPATGPRPTREAVAASLSHLEQVLFPMWVADAQFALDQVERLDRDATSPLRGRLDLARIGAFGWSFGGATAVDLSIRDERVKAAIDQDGQLFGLARVQGTKRPVLLMHNTSDPAAGVPASDRPVIEEMMKAVVAWDEKFRTASTGDVYDLKIARTGHGHFSDLTLFFPRDTSQLAPERAHAIVTDYTIAFFDRYLKGKASPLLAGASAAHPEVTFWRKGEGR